MAPVYSVQAQPIPFAADTTRLGDLIRQGGAEQAGLLLRGGDIQAQLWGNLGHIVQQAVAGYQQQTSPEAQMQRLELSQAQRSEQFMSTVNGIVAHLTQQNPDGSRTLDRGRLQQSFAQANVPLPMQQEVFKSLDDVDGSIQKFNALKVTHLADLAHGVLQSIQAGTDPQTALATGAALAKANGLVTDDQLAPIGQAVASGADIPSILTQLRGLSDKYKDVNKPILLPPTPEGAAPASLVTPTGNVVATGGQSQPKPPTEAELALKAAGGDATAAGAMGILKPKPQPTAATLAVQAANGDPQAQFALDKLNAVAKQRLDVELKRLNIAQSDGINADDPNAQKAMDVLGTFLAQTGRMPVGFRVYGKNSAQFYQGVAAKASDILKGGGTDLATNAAAYGANEGSLKTQQKFYDSAQAFLKTADSNAALLGETLKKIPDVGSPVFNKPLRAFTQNVQGDPNLAQFATYLTSVQNEYAKILTNPNLAGQLTDSARHEAQVLVSPSATVPQILASIQALQQEGGNRLKSIGDQIGTIKQRIGAQGVGTPPAPTTGGTVKMLAPDGKTVADVPADQVEHYKALGAKVIGG